MTISSHALRAELWIVRILKGGIMLSAGLMVAGLFLLSTQAGTMVLPAENPSVGDLYRTFFLETGAPNTASSFMYVGLVVLMFTPVFRVVATFVVYLSQRDWKYVAVAAFVLFMLIGDLIVAFR
jgi:uncharacterized membrane protein